MRFKSFLVGFICATAIVAVAYAQNSSQSNSHSKNGSSSASSSASSHGGGSQSGNGIGNGSGSGSGLSIPHPTHAVIYSAGNAWDSRKSTNQQALIQDHIDYWNRVIPTGKFIWGGPWRNEPGGMNLLFVKSDEEATKLVMADPAVQGGLLVPDIKPWYVGLDGTMAAAAANQANQIIR